MNTGVINLLSNKNIKEIFIAARYFYKYGDPIITDEVYRKLEMILQQTQPDFEYLQRTYDADDDTDAELLCDRYGIPKAEKFILLDESRLEKYSELFTEEASKSIEPIEDYDTAFHWFSQVKGQDLIFTLKVNGINTKTIQEMDDKGTFLKSYLPRLSTTRGRSGTSFDITGNLRRKFKKAYNLDSSSSSMIVFGEAYVESKALPRLRAKYDKKFVTPKSTAMSALRVTMDDEDYQHLKLKVFKITNIGTTLYETLELAEKAGYDVVPKKLVKASEIPDDFEEFKVWLKDILKHFEKISDEQDIPADGVVVELNDQVTFKMQGERAQYNLGNKALKLERWAPNVYKGIVKRILLEPRKESFSVRADIEPVTMADGSTATKVNLFNADIMIKNNIRVGSEILFEHKSEAAITLVYEFE